MEEDFGRGPWVTMKSALGLDEQDPTCFLYTYSIVMVLRKVRVLRRETIACSGPGGDRLPLPTPVLSLEGSLKSLGPYVFTAIHSSEHSVRHASALAGPRLLP